MKTCKRCDSRNSLLREDFEVICLMCGYVNETIKDPTSEQNKWRRMVEDLLDSEPREKGHKHGRNHTYSPAYGGTTTQNGVWSQ